MKVVPKISKRLFILVILVIGGMCSRLCWWNVQFELWVECAVVYMKFRDCFLRSLILLHVCSYWWNVQSAMLVECAV